MWQSGSCSAVRTPEGSARFEWDCHDISWDDPVIVAVRIVNEGNAHLSAI